MSKPSRIFLSYGHDEYARVAQQLKTDLVSRGYDVWFDADRLKPGGDWERYIEEGLDWVAGDSVPGWLILLITPHSVRRPDGYCLNELARAVARRLQILPVMLLWCEPPLSISRLQWLDMQGAFREGSLTGAYRDRLETLLRVLEDTSRLDQEGGQSHLAQLMGQVDFGAERNLHLGKFFGRRWVIDRLDGWLADPEGSKIFWITGPPGIGKSALATWYASNRSQVAAFYLCRHGHTLKSDPRRVVLSIVYDLSTQLPALRERLLQLNLEQIVSESANAAALFDSLVVQPLARDFPRPDRPVLVVIDGLDEATRDGRNELAEFITSEFGNTPDWLRLLITSRPDPEVRFPLQGIGAYRLEEHFRENNADIEAFLRSQLESATADPELLDRAVLRIRWSSEGLFLFVDWVLRELREGSLSLDRLDHFPDGLGQAYSRLFHRQFPNEGRYQQLVKPALDVIAAAFEPLAPETVAAICGWNDHESKRFERLVGSVFTVKDGVFQPFHTSIVQWLATSRAEQYAVSLVQGHVNLAGIGWEQYVNGVEQLSRYNLAHLSAHLVAAGRIDRAVVLLTDLTYLEAKCAAGMAYDLVRDYEALPTARLNREDARRVQEFRSFLRSMAHVFDRNPALVIPQAASQPLDSAPAQAADALLESEAQRRPLLQSCTHRYSNYTTLAGNGIAPKGMAFSLDQSRLYTCDREGNLLIWDLMTGARLAAFPSPVPDAADATVCRFAPDARSLLTSHRDGTVLVRSVENGGLLHRLVAGPGAIMFADFSPDGNEVLLGFENGRLALVSIADSIETVSFDGHTEWVKDAVFTPDGRHLLSLGPDETLIRWDAFTGAQIDTVLTTIRYDGVLSPDGSRFASFERRIRVWETGKGVQCARSEPLQVFETGIAYLQGGRQIAVMHDSGVLMFDAKTLQVSARRDRVGMRVVKCELSPDGRTLALALHGGTIELWDLDRSPEVSETTTAAAPDVNSYILSPDWKRMVTYGPTSGLCLWDSLAGKKVARLSARPGSPAAVSFTMDGLRFVALEPRDWRLEDGRMVPAGQGSIRIWDARTGVLLAERPCPVECYFDVQGPRAEALLTQGADLISAAWSSETASLIRFSPDCARVLVVKTDGSVSLRQVEGPTELWSAHPGRFRRRMLVSPDWTRLLVFRDDDVVLLDMASGKEVATFAGFDEAAFAPDGRTLVVSGPGRGLFLLDAKDGALRQKLSAKWHSCLTWAANGRVLGGQNGFSLMLYDLGQSSGPAIARPAGEADRFAFSPDGALLAIGRDRGLVTVMATANLESVAQLWLGANIMRLLWHPRRPMLAATLPQGGPAVLTLRNLPAADTRPAARWQSPYDGRSAVMCPACGAWVEVEHSPPSVVCPQCTVESAVAPEPLLAEWREERSAWGFWPHA